MASLIDIRRRIRSIKSSQQITKAMKMISAARLRRAQDRAIASRPYGRVLREVMASVSAQVAELLQSTSSTFASLFGRDASPRTDFRAAARSASYATNSSRGCSTSRATTVQATGVT